MSGAYRRIILKPPGIGSDASGELASKLAEAVALQQRLAGRSPHVLQLVGDLQETDQAFFVEHEPADPWPIERLFDPDSEKLAAEDLMRVAGALFEALKAAHTTEGRASVHGGLCPNVLVRTADGIDKVADFGFVPALCSVLGAECYMNLAARPVLSGPADLLGTGVWEVLPPDEFERPDRICAFIDPEKYGTQMLDTFEPGSDVIAAAFLLHLMAEHRHPYLFNEPDAVFIPEMCEFMAMGRFNGSRRKDLRESEEAGVRLWCDLVAKSLSRLPRDRPTTTELAEAISEYVKPPDAGEMLRRKLAAVEARLKETPAEEVEWETVRSEVAVIAEPSRDREGAVDIPSDVIERAKAIADRATGYMLVARIGKALSSDAWQDAGGALEELRAIEGLPEPLVAQRSNLRNRFNTYAAARDALEDIRREIPDGVGDVPADTRATLAGLQKRFASLPKDNALHPTQVTSKAQLAETLSARAGEVEAAIERMEAAIAEVRAKAEKYVGKLRKTADAGKWDDVELLLTSPPDIQPWPAEAKTRVDDVRRSLEAYRKEQKRKAEIEADQKTAGDWIAQVRTAVEVEEWSEAEKLLQAKPKLTHWPKAVTAEAEKLQQQIGTARKRQADHAAAAKWCAELEEAIAAGKWHVAFEKHSRRPTLDHWPDEVLAKEKAFEKQLDEKREEIERDRRLTEEQHAQARAWFEQAKAAVDRQDWEVAVDVLDERPDIERWPEGLLAEAEKIADTCRVHLGEQLLQQLRERTQAVKKLAAEFVARVVGERFDKLIDPGLVKTSIESEEFDSRGATSDGRAELILRVADPTGEMQDPGLRNSFEFQLKAKRQRICDDDGTLAGLIEMHLSEFITAAQRMRAPRVIEPLKRGVFPDVRFAAAVGQPTRELKARIDLLGDKSDKEALDAPLRWDAATLTWQFADEASVAKKAWNVLLKRAGQSLGPGLINKSSHLRCYKSALVVDVTSKPPTRTSAFGEAVTIDVALAIRPGGEGEARPLQTLAVACPKVGQVLLDIDLTSAEASLRKLVSGVQTTRRDAVANDLRVRIKAKSPKVRLFTHPAQITEPADSVSFELRARGHDPLTLQAAWDPETFDFKKVAEWNGSLEGYLNLPVKGGLPLVPVAGGVVALALVGVIFAMLTKNPPGPTPNDNRNGSGSPRAAEFFVKRTPTLPASIEPEQVVTGSFDWCVYTGETPPENPIWINVYAWRDASGRWAGPEPIAFYHDTPGHPPEECKTGEGISIRAPGSEGTYVLWAQGFPSTSESEAQEAFKRAVVLSEAGVAKKLGSVTVAKPEVVPPTPLSPDEALSEVRALLASSSRLADAVGDLVQTTSDAGRIRYRIPGLTDWQTIPLEPSADGTTWLIPSDEKGKIEKDFAFLEQLLSSKPRIEVRTFIGKMLEADPLVPPEIADPRLFKTEITATPTWELASDQSHWVGRVTAEIRLDVEPAVSIPVEGVRLALRNGQVEVTDTASSVPEAVKRATEQALLRVQRTAATKLLTGDAIASLPAGVNPPTDISIESLQRTVETVLPLEAVGLQPRTLRASWNPRKLAFDETHWLKGIDDLRYSADVIRGINERGRSGESWLAVGTSGEVSELTPPDNANNWLLAAPADWAGEAKIASELAPKDRLPIATQWRQGNETPAQAAERIVSTAEPDYWALLTTRRELMRSGEAGVAAYREQFTQSLAQTIGGTVASFLAAQPLASPTVELKSAQLSLSPRGMPDGLEMAFESRWSVIPDRVPPSLSAAKLAEAVGKLSEPATGTLRLTLEPGVGVGWSISGPNLAARLSEGVSKLEALQKRLSTVETLAKLDASLDKLLQGGDAVRLSGNDVLNVLNEIWKVKDAPNNTAVAQSQNLSGVIDALRETFNRKALWRKQPAVMPNVFVEYVCCAKNVYAVVWACTKNREITASERAALVRLCPVGQIDPNNADLGELLLKKVFEQVPEAIKARSPVAYDEQIGIVVAPDTCMAGIDLASLKFKKLRTRLRPLQAAGGLRPAPKEWSSLGDLWGQVSLMAYAADFRLTYYLADPTSDWPPGANAQDQEADRWAIATLNACTAR